MGMCYSRKRTEQQRFPQLCGGPASRRPVELPGRKRNAAFAVYGIRGAYCHTAVPASLQEFFVLLRLFYKKWAGSLKAARFRREPAMIQTLEDFCQQLYPDASARSLQKNQFWLLSLRSGKKKRAEYRLFWLAKRGGGYRPVSAPSPGLKQVQQGILSLLNHGDLSPHATAYRPGKNLLDNATPHVGKPLLVKLDIRNFFGSIRFPAVFHAIDQALRRAPRVGPHKKAYPPEAQEARNYNTVLSFFFSCFCTLDGVLPQGAPTSPMLSNLIFLPLDQHIAAFCEPHGIAYTRYSDDLTFSGDFAPDMLIRFVCRLLQENHFSLNEEKTVVARTGSQQRVTGVVVNSHPQGERAYRRRIRQELYNIHRFGLASHLLHEGRPDAALCPDSYLRGLLGRINFILQLCPYDREFLEYRTDCLALLRATTKPPL